MSTRTRQILLILGVLAAVLVIDQATKKLIVEWLPKVDGQFPGGHEDRFFRFSLQWNPGLVGGMFSGQPIIARLAPLAAFLVLGFLYTQLELQARLQSAAYGMVAGGAIGNMIDRFRLGAVIDFLQFHFYFVPFDFPWKYYPAFNVADSAICVGVFLLIASWYRAGTPAPTKDSDAPDPA